MEMNNKVAIIGGGIAGIVSAKHALDNGLEPFIFEKNSELGGIWCLNDNGSTWRGMKTNLSILTCMFSDYPWDLKQRYESSNMYPTNKEVFKYLSDYAEKFKLLPHFKFSTVVTKVDVAVPGDDGSNGWNVTWNYVDNNKGEQQQQTSDIFKYVIVASGFNTKPLQENINVKGLDINHPSVHIAQNYKSPDSFKDKRVLLIGGAYSGCEIACTLVGIAKEITMVSRKKHWISPRLNKKRPTDPIKPFDVNAYSRQSNLFYKGKTDDEIMTIKNTWLLSICEKQQTIPGLKVTTPFTHPPFVAISDNIIDLILEGKIQVPDTSQIVGVVPNHQNNKDNNVISIEFTNGDVKDYDSIILCNGYNLSLPFFSPEILQKIGYQNDTLQPVLLHKTVWAPSLKNIAFVGIYRGPYFGVMELQARWATAVFGKSVSLPSLEEMLKGVEEELKIRLANPRPQWPHGDYVKLADDIAVEIGVLPINSDGELHPSLVSKDESENQHLKKLLFSNSHSSVGYRLIGAHSNKDMAMNYLNMIDQYYFKE